MKSIVASLLIFAGLPMAHAEFSMPTQYSADQSITTEGKTFKTHTATDGEKIRLEMDQMGQNVVSIVRQDKKLMYMVMPSQKMYMEMPITALDEKMKGAELLTNKTAKFEDMGMDDVDGKKCQKYKITDGKNIAFMWVSDGTPVRMKTADGSTTVDWQNFKKGAVDATLFEPPADCQKMSMPSGAGMGQ